MTRSQFPSPLASWIWSPEHMLGEVNSHFEFSAELDVSAGRDGRIAITADTRYTLFFNGNRIADGPARGYPDTGYFDEIPVTIPAGRNLVTVLVDSYGIDTFQYRRGKPGLLFALLIGGETPLVSDAAWKVRRALEHRQDVARISCQQGFEEHFDARIHPAGWKTVILSPQSGRCLLPRTTGLLRHEAREIRSIIRAEKVKPLNRYWSFPVRRLLSPFPLGINLHGMAGAFAAIISSPERLPIRLYFLGPVAGLFLNGNRLESHKDQDLEWCDLDLLCGDNRLGIAICTECDHILDLALGSDAPDAVKWKSPLHDGEWAGSGPLWSCPVETNCFLNHAGPCERADKQFIPPFGSLFLKEKPALLEKAFSLAGGRDFNGFSSLPAGSGSNQDAYLAIRTDQRTGPATPETTVREAGTRLLFDLGEMSVGYFEMEIEASSGTVVDAYLFENLEQDRIQYLEHGGISYRNSFRYIAKEGINRFRSRQRRGGRYVQLVIRSAPVRILHLRVVEATYDAQAQGTFECSDGRLNEIYRVAQRTLLLCMEDTYTDCPTYEQAFWLGDARNEMLFAQYSFNASDLTEHSLRLAAHSLAQVPLVASQCPSGWDVLIPSFSFLWSIAVWEFYWQTGNEGFLREIYPSLRRNLVTAILYCTDHGLFSSPTWNFFDWTGIDQEQRTVLHNSMFLAAALDAGASAANLLGIADDEETFRTTRAKLARAIDATWNSKKQSYSDALLSDGSLSDRSSQHTSFLALLYGLVPPERASRVLNNCLNPPCGMTRVGSPNAMFFLLEALLKAGRNTESLAIVREFWGKMLDHGATTFWEMINPGETDFPTRSHCHGWASSPVYLLPQIFFGIELVEPGWRRIILHPQTLGLASIKAQIATPLGALKLELRHEQCLSPTLKYECPDAMHVSVAPDWWTHGEPNPSVNEVAVQDPTRPEK